MKKLKIATWNVNECVGITCNLDNQKTGDINVDNINQIINIINDNNIDVICFQEFPIIVGNMELIINDIKDKTNLKYFEYKATSPSYLFADGECGVAIFSKYKIEESKITLFNNPNLTKISKSGKIYKSFDKGIILIKIILDNEIYNIVTGHAIAFSPFDKTEFDYPESYEPLVQIINEYYSENLIVAGDFNCERLFELLPSINAKVKDYINQTTTYEFYENRGSVQMDYILLSKTLNGIDFKKIDNFSDHYVCLIDVEKNSEV